MRTAFPEAVVIECFPELLSTCSAAIDFDRGVLSVKEHGKWFRLPLHAANAAADWCYERLDSILPEDRIQTFYLRTILEWRKTNLSAPCTPCVPHLRHG